MPFVLRQPELVGPVEIDLGDFDPYEDNIFAIDTETTGLDPWGSYGVDRSFWPCRPFAFSLCDGQGNTAYVRWQVNARTRRVIPDQASFWRLQGWLVDPNLVKVFHNFQFDAHMLTHAGFELAGEFHDTYIRQHVLNPAEPNLGLKPLSKKYLEVDDDDQQDLIESVKKARRTAKKNGWAIADVKADYWLGDHKACKRYAVIDAYRTMALYLAQEEAFDEDQGLRNVYERERELMHVIRRMETRGVRIDAERSADIISYYDEVIRKASRTIIKEAGRDFNPNSSKQKTWLFFGVKGHTPLAYSRKGKTRTFTDCMHCKGDGCRVCQNTGRNPKCDGEFIESIALEHLDDDRVRVKDEFAHSILLNSAASTMKNYAEAYVRFSEETDEGHIVHPNYRQAGPITGRFSCSRPNLQNPASDESSKKKVDIPYRLREAFIPRDNFMLYIPDFSQIEIWILAILSGDEEMLEALSGGEDAHQVVADMVYEDAYDKKVAAEADHTPPEKRTKKQNKHLKIKKRIRKYIKTLNFGIIYGQGDVKTADSLGVSIEEARRFKAEYHERFPAVREFMSRTISIAEQKGYVVNPYGRVYPIDRRMSYRATNYLIQGTAAEVIKDGMIAVDKIKGIYQLLTIHDELMIEVLKKLHSKKLMKKVALRMACSWKFLRAPCPFPIGMKIAHNRWSENEEVEL